MARKKHPRQPLPPRGGLSASRIRLPGPDPTTAFEFVARVISEQRHRHPEDTEEAVMERFAQGEVVLIDASPVHPNDLIQPGTDLFFYRRPAPETPVPYEIETVYEDSDLLVVDKPPFLATMPRAAHITETATVRLRRATGNEELTPAHRLDRMTSGLLLFTKRREIRGAYQELFAARQVFKRYTAIAPALDIEVPAVWRNHIEKRHGEVASRIVIDAEPNAETVVRAIERLDPDHETHLHRIHGTNGPHARYLLEPVTGRTHQLRVQMCAAGAPILGDPVYPEVKAFGDEDYSVPMRLKSVELAFEDPLSGQERRFVADADLV